MSAAVFLVLEHEIPGLDAGVDGKAVCEHLERLDRISAEQELDGLMDYLGLDDEEARIQLAKLGASEAELQQVRSIWYPAQPGVDLVRTLRSALLCEPEFLGREELIRDLEDFERVLRAARDAGVGFYLGLDY